jgi:hypothetical protein
MSNFYFYTENTETRERTYIDGGFSFLDDKKVADTFHGLWLKHLDWLKERHPLEADEIYIAVDITDMSVYANIPEEDQDWVWVGNMVLEAS